jgi:hypothetical protein
MLAPVSWSASGAGVIAVKGTFDGQAARQLAMVLQHLPNACIVDFTHAHDVQLHALGTLLISLDLVYPREEIIVRGWNEHHLLVVESFGYRLDGRCRLLKHA